MEGPSGVIALVLAETAAGGSAVLWLSGLWGRVKRGFFVLTGTVLLGCALLAAASGEAGLVTASPEVARTGVLLLTGLAGVLGLSLCALILRWDQAGRWLGYASIPIAAGALFALARSISDSTGVLLQVAAGSAFMGAVTDGLLLGHWYLVDRRLPREHIRRLALVLLAAVGVEVIGVMLAGFGPAEISSRFSPFLAISGLATWLALGMVAVTALIAILIRATLGGREARAVQAATGFFYLAVITAFAAEMAAKVRLVG